MEENLTKSKNYIDFLLRKHPSILKLESELSEKSNDPEWSPSVYRKIYSFSNPLIN